VAFDLLFKSVVYTTQLALKHMMQNKWGRIINVASISVKEPLGYLALSNTIRAAVVTWAKSLANEVAPDKITVNNILTGYFDTERITDLNKKKSEQMGIPLDKVRKAMEDQVPLKRIGDPIEYGYLVAFLASDKAAYITGTNIPIDGGLLKSL
jgi:3-oxoacyl-[acyl-carrier protein] reductase